MTLACALAWAGLGVVRAASDEAKGTADAPAAGTPAPLSKDAVAPAEAGALPSPRPRTEPAPYPHKSVWRRHYGTGARSYWLFEPAEPKPEKAPVVVFHHGWMATNPGIYGAWIEHLARSGKVVIAPRYQADWSTPPAEFLANAIDAVRDALDVLETAPGHVRPDRTRFALVGHSAGGNLSVLMAAVAAENRLPVAKAVVAVMPGEVQFLPGPSLAKLAPSTLLAVVAAEHDWVVGDGRARQIFAEATSIPADRKCFVLYRTDRHGSPPVVADHIAATAALVEYDTGEGPLRTFQMAKAQTNALDKLGLWRLADLTIAAGFAGLSLDAATCRGELVRDLGTWSDGRPILQPVVGGDLGAIPRVVLPNGLRVVNRTAFLPPPPPAEPAAAPKGRPDVEVRRVSTVVP
jgi:acetyl esterase/lipase